MARNKMKELTNEDAIRLADEVAREIVDNRALVDARDQEIQAVQDKYNPHIASADKAIDAKIAMLAIWAKEHRKDLFGDKKSYETPLAILSFRYGNPTLKLLSSKDSWDDVIVQLKADKEGKAFVKVKEEADKRGLMKKAAEWLAKFRLRVTQSETFAVDPKTDKMD